jgi:L-rhamnose isomerase
MLKALLIALLEPFETLRKLELDMDYTQRLALIEEIKALPWAAVWNYYCEQKGVHVGASWIDEAKKYEKAVLGKRN